MGKFVLSQHSLAKLEGVHPDLIAVVKRALELSISVDFAVTCGLRTIGQQEKYLRDKTSTTMNSRHLTGHAVDLTPLWNKESVNGSNPDNWHYFATVAQFMKMASIDLKHPISWGGDWESFKDGYHYELTWAAYPLK